MWDYDDPCNKFPTLYFDVYVDAFFVVTPPAGWMMARRTMTP